MILPKQMVRGRIGTNARVNAGKSSASSGEVGSVRWISLLLIRTFVLGSAVACVSHNQTEQPMQAANVHQLARAVLSKINADRVFNSTIDASRDTMIGNLKRFGIDDAQATDLIDRLLLPDLRARMPELRTRCENILVLDFTPDEMQAVLSGESNAARQSARAKLPQMQSDFTNAGRSWGEAVGYEAFAKNRTTFEKLGINEKALAP